MNELVTTRIRSDFPEIVWEGMSAAWGIECGTGWGLLIYRFLIEASALCDKPDRELVVTQIKNKLGTLRLYSHIRNRPVGKNTDSATRGTQRFGCEFSFDVYPDVPAFRPLVEYYQEASAQICELCGRAGHIDRLASSRLMPLCLPHADLFKKSSPSEAPNEFKKIDLNTAKFVISFIDDLIQKGERR